jgi:histidine triad (HIT) family protein
MDSIFTKIVRREIPSTIEYEDDDVIVIHDINPITPIHLLIIPKKQIPTLNDINDHDDAALMGKLFLTAKRVAAAKGVGEKGYRLVMNVGKDGGQTVFHIHLHLLAGKPLAHETT